MDRVERRRAELKIKKEAVTAFVGVKPGSYSKWIKLRQRLGADTVMGICELLRMDPAKTAFSPPTEEFRLKGMPVSAMKTYSTRDKLHTFKMSLTIRADFTAVKLFHDLAAGYGSGENFDIVEKAYVHGVPKTGFTVAKVRGDSMVATLVNEDYVLLKDFPDKGYTLPQIEEKAQKTTLKEWQERTNIKHDDICVVDLGEKEGLTIKRVHYDVRRGVKNWKMLIVADNPHAWNDAWQVAVGDTVTFYGKLMGLCEKV